MAYDAATSQLVLFGGAGDSGILADTWTWDGSTWTQQSPATSPPALYYASMAYDAATSQLVLFGGADQTGLSAQTWTWDGSTWTQQAPAVSPPARQFASMAYDAATGQLILFGGYTQNDTWTWDGSTWTELSPPASPSARSGPSMAYDPATSQLVLFGGGWGTTIFADTWTWDGTTWTQQAPAISPGGRLYSPMAYDPAISQLVLFGGLGNQDSTDGLYGDTWSWDGSTWTQQAPYPAVSPPARQVAAMAYDPATSQLVLFGGVGLGYQTLGDTWTYGPERESQSIAFSTAAPSSASYRGASNRTYKAGASATSGLPVTLSIDSASTSGCTISGDIVSYGGAAGTCIIVANQPGNSSYLPAPSVTQGFTIGPAPLSVIASSAAMAYGGTVPVITARYSGFVGNDTAASLSARPSCTTTATSASPAGTYPSTCSGAADPNYEIGYIPAAVTVRKAATATTLSPEPDPSTRRSPVTLTATVMPTAGARIPAGDVNFYAGTTASHKLLGTASLTSSGTAVFTTTTLTCGSQQLYAVYLGSADDIGSTSAIVVEEIRGACAAAGPMPT